MLQFDAHPLSCLAVDLNTTNVLWLALAELGSGFTRRDDFGSLGVRVDVFLFAPSALLLEHVAAASRGDKAEERWRRVERASAEFGVCLQADEEGVVVHFEDLHTLPALILAGETKVSRLLKALDIIRTDFVAVPVTFPDGRFSAVQSSKL